MEQQREGPCPNSVAVSTSGDVSVADTGNNRILEIPWTYGAPTEVGSGLDSPHGVAVAVNGDVYIADTGNDRVVEVPCDRAKRTYGAQTTVGANLFRPEAVAIGSDGRSTLRISETAVWSKFLQAATQLSRARANNCGQPRK